MTTCSIGPSASRRPGWRASSLAAAIMTAFVGAASIGGASAQTSVIKVATATFNDTQHEWLRRFADAVDKNTNGRIRADIYAASQLGSIARMVEGTQLGSIQIWVGPPEFLVGLDARFELLSAPGLFTDVAHGLRTIADPEVSKAFLALGANKGLVGGSLFFTGPMAFAMRRPFRTLADLRGTKVRVLASPFQTEQLARLGGTGVPMNSADVLPALQQGAIDGSMSALTVMSTLQYQDAAKYLTETNHEVVFGEAFYSKRWFDGLAPDLQAAVTAASAKATAEAIPWGVDFVAIQRKEWVAKGGEVIALSPADHAEMLAKLAPIGDDIVNGKPELKPLWDILVAAAKRTK